ncbi:MAG: carboxymuconolactone decarboxylase family protein [Deltaproteobacteria bacterium]|nr:carboxymuconolactone decarboxylase family protein [Deltaproteobacteria bacterium]
MARIPDFKPAETETEKIQLQGAPPFNLNIFKIITHAPLAIARQFIGLPAAVLTGGKLDLILREMAITRAGILCNSHYEVHQHRKLCKRVGMPDEKIKALDIGSADPVFSELERLVLRFTEETVLNRKVGDETFSAISKHLSHEELVELAIAAGCYMMVSIFLNTFEVDLEGYEVPL